MSVYHDPNSKLPILHWIDKSTGADMVILCFEKEGYVSTEGRVSAVGAIHHIEEPELYAYVDPASNVQIIRIQSKGETVYFGAAKGDISPAPENIPLNLKRYKSAPEEAEAEFREVIKQFPHLAKTLKRFLPD